MRNTLIKVGTLNLMAANAKSRAANAMRNSLIKEGTLNLTGGKCYAQDLN